MNVPYSYDQLYYILLRLDVEDIPSFCQTERLATELCNDIFSDIWFWREFANQHNVDLKWVLEKAALSGFFSGVRTLLKYQDTGEPSLSLQKEVARKKYLTTLGVLLEGNIGIGNRKMARWVEMKGSRLFMATMGENVEDLTEILKNGDYEREELIGSLDYIVRRGVGILEMSIPNLILRKILDHVEEDDVNTAFDIVDDYAEDILGGRLVHDAFYIDLREILNKVFEDKYGHVSL